MISDSFHILKEKKGNNHETFAADAGKRADIQATSEI